MGSFSNWVPLTQQAFKIGQEARYTIQAHLRDGCNALYEALTGRPAPGTSVITARPHDHTALAGGAVLPRGFIGGIPDIGAQEGWIKKGIGSGGTGGWVPILSRTLKDGSEIPHVKLSLTPGIHAGVNNESGNPCTIAAEGVFHAYCDAGGGGDFEFRVSRLGTDGVLSNSSSVHSVTLAGDGSSLQRFWIADVPTGLGGEQEDRLEVRSTSGGNVGIQSCQFYETSEESQPVSKGLHKYDSIDLHTRP